MLEESIQERKFAGIIVGSQWYSKTHGRVVKVDKVKHHSDSGTDYRVEYLRAHYGKSHQNVGDFMSCVKAGEYNPQNPIAHDAVDYLKGL